MMGLQSTLLLAQLEEGSLLSEVTLSLDRSASLGFPPLFCFLEEGEDGIVILASEIVQRLGHADARDGASPLGLGRGGDGGGVLDRDPRRLVRRRVHVHTELGGGG